MKHKIILILLFAVVMVSVVGGISKYTSQKESDAIKKGTELSVGTLVIAEENKMAKAGIVGEELKLSRDDFARFLNLASVSDITFTAVPKERDGKLLVGNTVLRSGQTVSGSNISLISFVPATSKVTQASFRFSPNGASYDIECTLYLLDEVNYAPTVSIAPAVSLEANTYENVAHYGKLSAYDPDGDACVFEIVSYPQKGLLIMENNKTGEYLYLPNENYVGKDKFCYVARDKYGNYNASAEVSVSVSRAATPTRFADMEDSTAHASAIKLTEEGIMSGTQIGDGYYFQPNKSVSRGEFVVLAMRALGIKEVNSIRTSGFSDDGDIPSAMKGYIAAAHELGYINGKEIDGKLCFLPNEDITRAEAAVIVGRMIEAATPVITPALSDSEDIPAWAESSVYSLCSLGILNTVGGEVRAAEVVSRSDAAMILSAMMSFSR